MDPNAGSRARMARKTDISVTMPKTPCNTRQMPPRMLFISHRTASGRHELLLVWKRAK